MLHEAVAERDAALEHANAHVAALQEAVALRDGAVAALERDVKALAADLAAATSETALQRGRVETQAREQVLWGTRLTPAVCLLAACAVVLGGSGGERSPWCGLVVLVWA